MRTAQHELQSHAAFTVASRSGLDQDVIFALQGWAPAKQVGSLATELTAAGVPAAVEILQPAEDEQPPTFIQYPRWARPIKALFDMLGTLPGYREYDLALSSVRPRRQYEAVGR